MSCISVRMNHIFLYIVKKNLHMWGWFMAFNASFNNISVISWRSVYNAGRNWSTRREPQTCRKSLTNYHIMLYRVQLAMSWIQTLNFCGNSHWLHRYICSCKSSYHTIMIVTSPLAYEESIYSNSERQEMLTLKYNL